MIQQIIIIQTMMITIIKEITFNKRQIINMNQIIKAMEVRIIITNILMSLSIKYCIGFDAGNHNFGDYDRDNDYGGSNDYGGASKLHLTF